MRVVVGTRGSPLAMTQTRWVVERLQRRHPDVEFAIKKIRTQGDVKGEAPLASMPRGLFAKELEAALAEGAIDLAVHSFKDLPAEMGQEFVVAAITEREDPRDVLVAPRYQSLDALPAGARLGTSSARRTAQLKAYRPDLELRPIRGNVGTRVAKAQGQDLDGVVLAAAGLHRLGMQDRITEYLDPSICLPEAGQGALAVEARVEDARAQRIAAAADHAATRAVVAAEVTAVRRLGGGCTVPIAAYAVVEDGRIVLRGMVANSIGDRLVRSDAEGSADQPEEVGRRLAQRLLELGAGELLARERR